MHTNRDHGAVSSNDDLATAVGLIDAVLLSAIFWLCVVVVN